MTNEQLLEGGKIQEEINLVEKTLLSFKEAQRRMQTTSERPDSMNFNSFYVSIQGVSDEIKAISNDKFCKVISEETYRMSCLFMLSSFIMEAEKKLSDLKKQFAEL